MNDDNDLMTIRIRIENEYYPMKNVRRDEEVFYREAAKRIEDNLNQYRDRFPNLDKEKYLTMIAFHMSLKAVRLEKKNDTKPYRDKIEELTRTIEDFLGEN
ncbi:MAG: cell division protein ZapA [Bacteroidaceae bacterium]|nr:cell division protein ZapA [Bacteroidaceae bacterium]